MIICKSSHILDALYVVTRTWEDVGSIDSYAMWMAAALNKSDWNS